MTHATRKLVDEVMTALEYAHLDVWLFGGWAEELRCLRRPGHHADIDLLLRAGDFVDLEVFVATLPAVMEIGEKRFSHKCAYVWEGIRVELLLVRPGVPATTSFFNGRFRIEWPMDTFAQAPVAGLPVASAAALSRYRREYDAVARARAAFRSAHARGTPEPDI